MMYSLTARDLNNSRKFTLIEELERIAVDREASKGDTETEPH